MATNDTRRENFILKKLAEKKFVVLDHLIPHCLLEVGSTQDYLSMVLQSERQGEFVVSRIQSSGKGRDGRIWVSDEGGLFLSITLTPRRSEVLDKIAPMISQSICTTFGKYYSLWNCKIKFPNDVLCDRKKIGGVLVDATIKGTRSITYVGIGVNLNNGDGWPGELQQIATSYLNQTFQTLSIDDFLVYLLKEIDNEYSELY